jgi:hypothetical protein
MPNKGFLYIACGSEYTQMATISACSVRQHIPDAHITYFTAKDEEVPDGVFNHIERVDMQKQPSVMKGFHGKIENIHNSPYKKTLFLDSDTYVCEDITNSFRMLDYFDIAMCQAPGERPARQPISPYEAIDGLIPYNCGVMFFKKNKRTEMLFHNWRKKYWSQTPGRNEYKKKPRWREQHPFIQAYMATPNVQIHHLNSVYNVRRHSHLTLKGNVKILHGRHGHTIGKRLYTKEDFEAWKTLLNVTDEMRLWNPTTKSVIRKGNVWTFEGFKGT